MAVPVPEGERIARLEQRQDDFDDKVDALDRRLSADHHRLRDVEAAVGHMVEAQKDARRAEERQYRRLELRIQWGGLAMAVGMLVFSAVQIYVAMRHH